MAERVVPETKLPVHRYDPERAEELAKELEEEARVLKDTLRDLGNQGITQTQMRTLRFVPIRFE